MSNETFDLMEVGCFLSYDTIACARSSFLGALVLMTMILLIKAAINMKKNFKDETFESVAYQVFILIFAFFLSILCFVNWLLGAHLPQIDLAASCMKLVILINVLLIYGTKALRLVRREICITFGLAPLCFCLGFYGLFIAVTGMNDVGTTWDECYKPYWIMLSSADVVLVGIITGSAVTIHKSANLIAIEKVVVSELLKRLWTFIVLIQISAVVTFGYDIAVRVLGGSELSCSGIFFHSQIVYSSILTIIMTAKFLFPLWGFLYAFDRKSFITVPHETKIFVVTQGDHSYRVLTTGRRCAYDDNASLLCSAHEAQCSAHEEPSTTQAIFGGAPVSTGLRSPPNQGALSPKEYWKTRTRHSRGSTLSMIKEDIVREVVVEVRTTAEVNQEPLH